MGKTTFVSLILGMFLVLGSSLSFADAPAQLLLTMYAHGKVLTFALDNHYELDVLPDNQGDAVRFRFFGVKQDRIILASEIMDGKEATNLLVAPVIGNVLWISAAPGFTTKNGGLVNIKYASSWGMRGLHFATNISTFQVNLVRLGKKWIAEAAKTRAQIHTIDIAVTGNSDTFTFN